MKKIDLKFSVMLLSFMLLAPMILSAQTPTDATVTLTPAATGSVTGMFYVLLPDTNNLEAVEIQLGSEADSANLVNYTFGYDVTTGLPSGFSWNREGLKLYLNVGTFAQTDLRFGKVRLRRVGAGWGNEYAFVAN